jgi:hypothetical protein
VVLEGAGEAGEAKVSVPPPVQALDEAPPVQGEVVEAGAGQVSIVVHPFDVVNSICTVYNNYTVYNNSGDEGGRGEAGLTRHCNGATGL